MRLDKKFLGWIVIGSKRARRRVGFSEPRSGASPHPGTRRTADQGCALRPLSPTRRWAPRLVQSPPESLTPATTRPRALAAWI